MYLKSLNIKKFRKFGEGDNTIYFVSGDKSESSNNIAAATTLIVGRNNAGKTTVIKAIDFILRGTNPKSCDINLIYLKKVYEKYSEAYAGGTFEDLDEYPSIEFCISIGVEENLSSTIISNLSELIDISFATNDSDSTVDCRITYEIKEQAVFKENVKVLLSKVHSTKGELHFDPFKKFLLLIDHAEFRKKYWRKNGDMVDPSFKLSDLIDLEFISANKPLDEKGLSSMFNKIITRKCSPKIKSTTFNSLNDTIDSLNESLATEIIQHKPDVNGVLGCIESTKHLEVELSSDINIDNILSRLVKYEYNEGRTLIPEGQFGLGYANLMHIIGQVIDYVDKCPDNKMQSKVNLICIEEPEAFMHPQMQENFIVNIDKAVKYLLNGSSKNINSQLVVTTHSSHVLHSKIHSSNSFDNINYMSTKRGFPIVVQLNDKKLEEVLNIDESKEASKLLSFLKKHIKYKASELFFADAAILIEGVTEDVLLRYYLEQSPIGKYHITTFQIDGAHGLVYYPLVKLLQLPTLIITDFDLQRSAEERGAVKNDGEKPVYLQIDNLAGRHTTNATIKFFFKGDNLEDLPPFLDDDVIRCVFQRNPIEGLYATSFEEAYILTNFNNDIFNRALRSVKPNVYSSIVGKAGEEEVEKLKNNSYQFQKKLSKSKSGLATALLYEIVNANEDPIPVLPEYILGGFEWLKKQFAHGDS
ncbi:AAA family ATPase [Maridesulfovibrio sp.]|uniref:AAA family ATPase n=1 Tax=Maridesulfovibrio sp. TaxID=2795000 RepID=UPI002AA8E16B|nr:AAA family ATPase [Maridesulfovibrio sp.]